jgi:hypothetical protein
MNKNLVVITSMTGKVDISCEPYCVNTWKYWCNKNNVDLIILKESLSDTSYMKPTWQRWYIWDILENSEMEYEKVTLVDVDTMIRWDSPNFFNEISISEIGVCSDNDNINWVKQSIDGYKQLFPDTKLDWTEYFNCGFVVMGNHCKSLCKKIINFWEENQEKLVSLQNNLRKGTDQTPVNYIVKQSSDVKYLNKKWNLTHLNRKEILNNFMFIDCGYIWHFNGFDKSMRKDIMKQTWELIKDNYEN